MPYYCFYKDDPTEIYAVLETEEDAIAWCGINTSATYEWGSKMTNEGLKEAIAEKGNDLDRAPIAFVNGMDNLVFHMETLK